jgi:RsiW-degrading membrane proteinase PrsW (M82 family)
VNFAALALGVLPVVLFLLGLQFLDSYKLVRRGVLWQSLIAGVLAAGIAFAINVSLLHALGVPDAWVKRAIAPVLEEIMKAALIVLLVRADRVGFMVDAAIHGFAVGTAFAVVENLYYAWALPDGSIALWVVRGLGTAILHGSTTAIVGILSKDLTERRRSRSLVLFLPGLLIAIVAHALYNQLVVNPLLSTAALLVILPLVVVVVYERSERATRDWLGHGLDNDSELLESVLSGEVRHTAAGRYLESLRHRFEGPVLADMLCLLQIHLELSLRAKGILIARKAGIEVAPDPAVLRNLAELRFLEHSIGRTGRLAMLPLLGTSERDLWQVGLLRH